MLGKNPEQRGKPIKLTMPNPGLLPVQIPEGMSLPQFLNSPANLGDLVRNHGLARLGEIIAFQKAIGRSPDTDLALIYDTSGEIEDPGGRPTMLHQLPDSIRSERGKLLHAALEHMANQYPNADTDMIMLASGSIDGRKGYEGALRRERSVPSIFMNHVHAIAFSKDTLQGRTPGISMREIGLEEDSSLDDNGFDPILEQYISGIFSDYFSGLDLQHFDISDNEAGAGIIEGFPQGLPPFKIKQGINALQEDEFWEELASMSEGMSDLFKIISFTLQNRRDFSRANLINRDVSDNALSYFKNQKEVRKSARGKNHNMDNRFGTILYRGKNGSFYLKFAPSFYNKGRFVEAMGISVDRKSDSEAFRQFSGQLQGNNFGTRGAMIEAVPELQILNPQLWK